MSTGARGGNNISTFVIQQPRCISDVYVVSVPLWGASQGSGS